MDWRAEIEAAVRHGFDNYVNFEGREPRLRFWMWVVFVFGVGLVSSILDRILGTTNLVGGLTSLALFLPGLGYAARRLHDVGKSGWYLLAVLIPVLGWIYLIYLYAQPGMPGTNEWGPAPV